MAAQTLDSLESELKAARAELSELQAGFERQLLSAAAIQRSLLPVRSPLVKGIRTAWEFRPSCHLGGDNLNIFLLNDRQIGFYVLDVSGHGVAASLLSVAVSHFLSPFSQYSFVRETGYDPAAAQPAEVAGRLNLQFASHPEFSQFFTLVYGILDTSTHELSYVSAGGPPPFLVSGGRPRVLESTGLPIGIDLSAEYTGSVVRLERGDRLFLYSDGITEARSPGGELYEDGRLQAEAARSTREPLAQAVSGVIRSVEAWCVDRLPDDDVSFLAVEVCPVRCIE